MKKCVRKLYSNSSNVEVIFITDKATDSIQNIQSQQDDCSSKSYIIKEKSLFKDFTKKQNLFKGRQPKKNTSILSFTRQINNQSQLKRMITNKQNQSKSTNNIASTKMTKNASIFKKQQTIKFKQQSLHNSRLVQKLQTTQFNSKFKTDFKQQNETQYMFKMLERNIISTKQKQQMNKKSKNFYQSLRIKLLNQVDQISRDYKKSQKQNQRFQLLIEGCNMQKHKRTPFRTDRCKSKNNKEILNINSKNWLFQQKDNQKVKNVSYDPKKSKFSSSSQIDYGKGTNLSNVKAKVSQSKRRNYSYRQNSNENIYNHKQTAINSINNSFVQNSLMPKQSQRRLSRTTNKRSQSMKINRKQLQIQSNRQQKINVLSKLQILKQQCEVQNYNANDLKKKMKLFGHYCKKIDKGFDDISTKITNYLSNL